METTYLSELIPLTVDYICHLTGDANVVSSLTLRVLTSVAEVPAPFSREEARIQALALATAQARLHNSTQAWIEAPPIILANKAAQKAQESIWYAVGQMPVLHRAVLVLSDMLAIDELLIARIVRLPISETLLLLNASRAEFNAYLAHIVKARAQFPLDKILPAVALGLKSRHQPARSALALLPICRLSVEQSAVIHADLEASLYAEDKLFDTLHHPYHRPTQPALVLTQPSAVTTHAFWF